MTGRGDAQVVSLLAFNSKDQSSDPADVHVYNFIV